MKKLITLTILMIFLFGCSNSKTSNTTGYPQNTTISTSNTAEVTEKANGLGTGIDQYGRPVQATPYFNDTAGYYGDSHVEKPNAYGPGIHMDQYGRPIQMTPQY